MPVFDPVREDLLRAFCEGLRQLSARELVREFLASRSGGFNASLLAVGKAARHMAAGAVDAMAGETSSGHGRAERPTAGLVIHPRDQDTPALPEALSCLPGEHPVPGTGSFRAGEAALAFCANPAPDTELLVLLSGGGSALMEAPAQGVDRDTCVAAHQWLLGSGLDIVDMNRVRQALSAVKGGKLARQLDPDRARVLCLSDVPEGRLPALASGPFLPPLEDALPSGLPDWLARAVPSVPHSSVPEIPHHVLADARTAGQCMARRMEAAGYSVSQETQRLEGEVPAVARRIGEWLSSPGPGARVWWGEMSMTLPEEPGQGGRCQHLALAVAHQLAGRTGWYLLACGTDGVDGPGDSAGALVDGETISRGLSAGLDPESALARADSGRFLEAAGDLVHTGPTGTNLNEVLVAAKDDSVERA